MITAIVHGHVVERVTRELTDADQHRITTALAAQGIRVCPVVDVYRVVHLWAAAALTTRQEVRAVAAFRVVTDARINFHPAVASC